MDFRLASVTVYGFQEYAKVYIPSYNEYIKVVASFLANAGGTVKQSDIMSKELSIPLVIVNHIIDLFEQKGFVKKNEMSVILQ